MPALTSNHSRDHKVHQRRTNVVAAAAGEVYYVGAYLLRRAASALATVAAPAAGMKPLGVVVETLFPDDPAASHAHLDNSTGADGEVRPGTENSVRVVRYDQAGEWAFPVAGAEPLPEEPAYLVDDNTVSAADPGHGIVAGVFTRPARRPGDWYVDVARRSA